MRKLKDLPKPGYYWVPASVDSSQSLITLAWQPHGNFKLGASRKKINNRVYYKVGTPKNDFVLTMATLDNLPQKFENVSQPMLDLFKDTDFSLYGVPDTPKDDNSNMAKLRRTILKRTYVLQDSGGFQLSTGVKDFVDPKEVAASHSKYANSGVSLDVPGSGLNNHDLVIASAKMLAANSAKIQKHLTEPVRLLNVCHGSSLKIRHDYLKVVLENPLDSLCVGGLRAPAAAAYSDFDRTSPVIFASHILLAVLMGEKHYQHFHILGVSSDWQMALMALIARVHGKVITSDSATYKLSGLAGIHFGYGDPSGSSQRLSRGQHGWTTTRCSCPVCQIVGYDLVYTENFASVSMVHNAFAIHERAKTFSTLAFEVKDTSSLIKTYLASFHGSKVNDPKWTRKFVAAVHLILNTTKVDQLKVLPRETLTSIFGHTVQNDKGEKKFAEIIKRYEAYHKKKFL